MLCVCSAPSLLPLPRKAFLHGQEKILTPSFRYSHSLLSGYAPRKFYETETPVNIFASVPKMSLFGKSSSTEKALEKPQNNYVARVKDDKSFDDYTRKGQAPFPYVVICFSASWCGPCRKFGPVFKTFSKKFSNALFLKVDIDDCPQTSKRFEIASVPTIVVLDSERKPLKRLVGFGPNSSKLDLKDTLKHPQK